jgi:hypothetical protein
MSARVEDKMTAPSPPPRIPLSPLENLAVGAAGGALETCLQMPILTYKFCLQEGRALPTSMTGWYRGVGVQAGRFLFVCGMYVII